MKSYPKTVILAFLAFFTSNAFALASYTDSSSAVALANKIQGNGIKITNPKITKGANQQRGIFTKGISGANLEIDEGIILTTGSVKGTFKPNSGPGISVSNGVTYSDSDLKAIDSLSVYDPIIFEFDVTLDKNTRLLLINYQFASEEYPEYVGSRYNDAFGFFISGGDLKKTYNIARVVDNNTYVTVDNLTNFSPVTINNVNIGTRGANGSASTPANYTNAAFFIDNNQANTTIKGKKGVSPVIIEYDGLTKTLNATLDNLTPGQTYHFKMALADTGDASLDSAVFVNQIQGLREPSLCYDYAYKQDGQYLTEAYSELKGPHISTTSSSTSINKPIELGIYFKNTEVSELKISNVSLSFLDLNTTQATYRKEQPTKDPKESIYVTNPGQILKKGISDTLLNVSPDGSFVKDIPIASFDSLEHFYAYILLDPKTSKLDLPIKANLNYTLTIPLSATDKLTLDRFTTIDGDIPICAADLTSYTPDYGIFNIVESNPNIYDVSQTTKRFYNLNTQVTNRPASLQAIAMHEETDPNLDPHRPKNVSTIIAVDMIDLESFHDTAASCNEASSSIANRVWLVFNNSAQTAFSVAADYFQYARKNAAYRITYNLTNDDKNSLIRTQLQPDGKTYKIINYPEMIQKIPSDKCYQNSSKKILTECNNAESGFSKAQLDACMECVYGYNTSFVCSRDNFAIRPEAFLLNIHDQNQTNDASKLSLASNHSGVLAPVTTDLALTADYNYNLHITAVNHANNNVSVGYRTSDLNATYSWTPLASQIVLGCNDITDKNITTTTNPNFYDGLVDTNTSIEQVGRYTLSVLDKKWTSVDWDPTYLNHHKSIYFLKSTDCISGSSVVAKSSDYSSGNGCNISSTHTNADTNLKYTNLNVLLHPFQFDRESVKFFYGIDNNEYNATAANFVYNNNIFGNEENMSVHYDGNIVAKGYNGAQLSNFVEECYSKDLNVSLGVLDLGLSDTDGNPVFYKYRFHNKDINGATIVSEDINNTNVPSGTDISLSIPSTYFKKDQNGALNARLNMNFHKDVNQTVNPKIVTYPSSFIAITCITPNVCKSSAQLKSDLFSSSNNIKEGVVASEITYPAITHYYGRSFIAKQKFAGQTGTARLNYEFYANTDADPSYRSVTNKSLDDDLNWYINVDHNITNHGGVAVVQQKTGSRVGASPITIVQPRSTSLAYDGSRDFPYATTMTHKPQSWLIYNKHSGTAVFNEFDVEFIEGQNGSWAGKHETNSTTRTKAAPFTNRRTMW